jgi:hypothetical protein
MFSGGDSSSSTAKAGTTADPVVMSDSVPTQDQDIDQPSGAPPTTGAELPAVVPPVSSTPSPVSVSSNDLLSIKQQALQQLSPLLGHLDQPPEERFRTTMMMIQASDDSNLLQAAYAAAQQIPDEKIRAQALLDVVNEINYFTQHDDGASEPA